jgi:hypothetical protein
VFGGGIGWCVISSLLFLISLLFYFFVCVLPRSMVDLVGFIFLHSMQNEMATIKRLLFIVFSQNKCNVSITYVSSF